MRISSPSTAFLILPSSTSASAIAPASPSSVPSSTMMPRSSIRPSSSLKRSSSPWSRDSRPVTRVALSWSSQRSGAATCSPRSAISARMPSRSSTWPIVFMVAWSCLISVSKSGPATRTNTTGRPTARRIRSGLAAEHLGGVPAPVVALACGERHQPEGRGSGGSLRCAPASASIPRTRCARSGSPRRCSRRPSSGRSARTTGPELLVPMSSRLAIRRAFLTAYFCRQALIRNTRRLCCVTPVVRGREDVPAVLRGRGDPFGLSGAGPRHRSARRPACRSGRRRRGRRRGCAG